MYLRDHCLYCSKVAYARNLQPEDIRDKLDIGFRIDGQSVEIFEISPLFLDPDEKMECPVAKATYVRTRRVWKVYWQMRDLKWRGYPAPPEVRSLKKFLELVDEDDLCCFWG